MLQHEAYGSWSDVHTRTSLQSKRQDLRKVLLTSHLDSLTGLAMPDDLRIRTTGLLGGLSHLCSRFRTIVDVELAADYRVQALDSGMRPVAGELKLVLHTRSPKRL